MSVIWNTKEGTHYVSQAGQPYGSVRRCCSSCGVMVLPELKFVTEEEWNNLPAEERCTIWK
jgi:hypothetical protein